MANIPLEFTTANIIINNTLHLAYGFDVLSKVETVHAELPVKQATPIKALQLNLTGKTSNPSISVSMEGKTNLFTLNTAYITDRYPHVKETAMNIAFVIEGYSIVNVKKEKVLIFLPMTITTETSNLFYPLEQTIVNNTPITGFTFNDYIPKSSIETDAYLYYNHTDDDGCFYHILYFQSSPLKYTSALKIPVNRDEYKSDYKVNSYKSAMLSKQHDNMNTQFEDNIYIDCVPVELENQKAVKFLDFSKDAGSMYVEMLTYLVYVVMLTILVYGIYYVHIYSSQVPGLTASASASATGSKP